MRVVVDPSPLAGEGPRRRRGDEGAREAHAGLKSNKNIRVFTLTPQHHVCEDNSAARFPRICLAIARGETGV